jgi:hypothetical protein
MVIASLFGSAFGLAAGAATLSLLAAPVFVSIATAAAGGLASAKIWHYISGLRKSDTWIETTERHSYKAPDGHVIIADPTY